MSTITDHRIQKAALAIETLEKVKKDPTKYFPKFRTEDELDACEGSHTIFIFSEDGECWYIIHEVETPYEGALELGHIRIE